MVERARLESVYTPKVYRGFESLPLRDKIVKNALIISIRAFFMLEKLKGCKMGCKLFIRYYCLISSDYFQFQHSTDRLLSFKLKD